MLRSVGAQLKGLPNKNFCYFPPALCFARSTTTSRCKSGDKRLMPFNQYLFNESFACCDTFRNRTTIRYQGLNEEDDLGIDQKMVPNLDVKPAIRNVVVPVAKDTTISYISPEFKKLLQKHDARMQQKYILHFLPEQYTRQISGYKQLKAKPDKIKPYCICAELKAAKATAADGLKSSKKRNFFKSLSCCTKAAGSAEDFQECQCLRGKQGVCEMCSQRLANKTILKKNPSSLPDSKGRSNEALKDDRDLQNHYWVGTPDDMQKYRSKGIFEKQTERQPAVQLTKKDVKAQTRKMDKKRT